MITDNHNLTFRSCAQYGIRVFVMRKNIYNRPEADMADGRGTRQWIMGDGGNIAGCRRFTQDVFANAKHFTESEIRIADMIQLLIKNVYFCKCLREIVSKQEKHCDTVLVYKNRQSFEGGQSIMLSLVCICCYGSIATGVRYVPFNTVPSVAFADANRQTDMST